MWGSLRISCGFYGNPQKESLAGSLSGVSLAMPCGFRDEDFLGISWGFPDEDSVGISDIVGIPFCFRGKSLLGVLLGFSRDSLRDSLGVPRRFHGDS